MSGIPKLRRIVIVRTDLLGETVLTLSAARRLKEAVPGVSVTMVVAPGMEALIRLCPDVDQVLTHPPECDGGWRWRALRLGARLAQGRYDAVIVINPTKSLHLAAWASRIPVRIGYARKGGARLLTHAMPEQAWEGHEVDRYAALLALAGIEGAMPVPRLEPDAWLAAIGERLQAAGIDPDEPLVAMHPWASKAFKRWPLERFAALGHRLAESGTRVIVIGGLEHLAESPQLQGPWLNWTGQTSLTELAALLRCCRCLIANDTGPVHLAAAVGTPAVVLFGTTDPAAAARRWSPRGEGHQVVSRPAIGEIPPEAVWEAVRQAVELPWTGAYAS